jgi:predicted aspartyl protease
MLTEVNFRLAGGAQPLILVPATVNGIGPHEFILDTGAGVSLLTPEFAERVGVTITESTEGMGAGGKVAISLGVVESLAIGQATAENVQVAVTSEIQRIGAVIGASLDGDIGYSYLKNFRLTLDYRKLTLQLTDAGQDSNGDSNSLRAEIKFKLAHPSKPLIIIPTFVNDEGPFIFALDTGASSTVVSSEVAQILGIETTGIPQMTGAGGAMQGSKGIVRSLAVGNARLENLPVAIADFLTMLSRVVKTKLDGIIGYNFLKEFKVTIDYINETLRLVSNL